MTEFLGLLPHFSFMKLSLILAGISLLMASSECTQAQVQNRSLELLDVEGKAFHPLQVGEGKKGSVLVFVSPYCPTAGKFLSEVNKIAAQFEGKFEFYLVHSDPETKVTDAYQQAILNEVKITVLLDKQQVLAKAVDARITPEVAVLDAKGGTLYQGRINDLYLGPTKRQRQATTKDLIDALEAVTAGKPVPVAKTEAVGCKIGGRS